MEETQFLLTFDYSTASKEALEVLVEEASEPSLFEEIANANMNRPEILNLLLEHPDTPEDLRKKINDRLQLPAKQVTEVVRARKSPEARTESILQKIQRLNITERRRLALIGGRTARSVLAKDPNKEVVLSLLDNQKITEPEIELIARSRTVFEEAIRKITRKREWMKNYQIIHAVVTNPKTPPGVAVTLLSELKTRDLVILEKSKNVSEAVRAAAKRLIQARKGH